MNPQLQQAVKERVDLGREKAQIVAELKAAGYDDDTIESVYQIATGVNTPPMPTSTIPTMVSAKKTISPWLIAFAPVLFFIGVIILWGVVNLFTQGSDSDVLTFISNVSIPFLMGATFLAVPICIVVALIVAFRKYDGVIRCGNCNYNGMGESARSVWAQVLAWLAFFIFWPITLAYYLLTHRYRCPKCKSTFVGMRDKSGNYSAPNGGAGAVVVILVIIFIAVIGILSAVVLASLNDARESAQDASRAAEQQRQLNSESINIPRPPRFDAE